MGSGKKEIEEMDTTNRVFVLAKSSDPKLKDFRMASDKTVYHKDPATGVLRRVKVKETKAERRARKKALVQRSEAVK